MSTDRTLDAIASWLYARFGRGGVVWEKAPENMRTNFRQDAAEFLSEVRAVSARVSSEEDAEDFVREMGNLGPCPFCGVGVGHTYHDCKPDPRTAPPMEPSTHYRVDPQTGVLRRIPSQDAIRTREAPRELYSPSERWRAMLDGARTLRWRADLTEEVDALTAGRYRATAEILEHLAEGGETV